MKAHSRLTVIILAIALLAACAPVPTPAPTATPTLTPEPTATSTPTVTPTETVMPTATATVRPLPVVDLNPEIYIVDVTSMPEVDRRAFEMAPSVYNMGIKAYSLRLRRVVYVNQENYVVGIFNTGEKHIADEYGNFFEGVQPATGFENVMIVIMRKGNEQFVLAADYRDRTVLDKEGPEKLASAMRAALAISYLYQKYKTTTPDKSNEWQTWTRGEGAAMFDKDSKATVVINRKIVKLSDPIIIITGRDGADFLAYKDAVITVDNNGFQFIGFDTVQSSSPYLRASGSYTTFPFTFSRYSNMNSQTWIYLVGNVAEAYLCNGGCSKNYDRILIQRDVIVP